MRTRHTAQNEGQLLDAIGTGVMDPGCSGPNPVIIELPDGREVVGNYHRCEETEIGAKTNTDVFLDTTPLIPLMKGLVNEGKPFITETGSSDMICTLIWTIREKVPERRQAKKIGLNPDQLGLALALGHSL